jgi:predicted aspartyl protease
MKRRFTVKLLHHSLAALIVLFCSASLYAGGGFSIVEDEAGIYIQTDADGAWYLDNAYAAHFRIGETGHYEVRSGTGGLYLDTDKGVRIYLDRREYRRAKREIREWEEYLASQPEPLFRQGEETAVIIEGNAVLVPVTLGYGGNEIEALLQLDTGASHVLLHRELADRLGLKSLRTIRGRLADGREATADLVKLDYVQAGPVRKEGLYANVITHEGAPVRRDGLLGMDFLRGLEYRVDFKNKVIHWEP